jgi:hypothetical protein
MFNEVPDAVCGFALFVGFHSKRKSNCQKKRIGQHKSISISLPIHILMSKNLSESGGGRQAPKGWHYFLFSSFQPLELGCCAIKVLNSGLWQIAASFFPRLKSYSGGYSGLLQIAIYYQTMTNTSDR